MPQVVLKCTVVAALGLAALALPVAGHAYTFTVLHTFTGARNDGAVPMYGSLIKDKKGNLYGTTYGGGTHGGGVVFRLAPDGTFTVLYSFGSSLTDGFNPYGGVIRDSAGNLYGTTYFGGTNGYGTVFKLAPDGTETILHSFAGSDGEWPYDDSLNIDAAGNLYGTASQGGVGDCPDWSDGCGTAFEIASDGTFTKLHDFSEDVDEVFPNGLVRDDAGNLYGTTNGSPYYGTVFKLAPDGTETILHEFGGANDGAWPAAGPIRDSAGNLYGTAQFGGGANRDGTVFKVAPDGTETTLHDFDGSDGVQPLGTLARDKAGNLYGTTYQGGKGCDGAGCGVVFKVKADGTFRVLHKFDCASDGCWPRAGLLKDGSGNLYGTTKMGGAQNDGTVFELIK